MFLRLMLVSAILAIFPADSSAQLFRRAFRGGGGVSRSYLEMGCDCSTCVANRGGTYAQVFGRVSDGQIITPPKNPSAPSPIEVVELALRLADIQPYDLLYDVGSGDGRVLEVAVRDYGCRAVGIEQSSSVAVDSIQRLNSVEGLASRWSVTIGDATKYDLGQATVAYLNLYPDVVAAVVPRLKGCTRIVSFKHQIPGHDNQRYETEWGPIYLVELAAAGNGIPAAVATPSGESWSAFDDCDSWSTTKNVTPTKSSPIVQVARKECST